VPDLDERPLLAVEGVMVSLGRGNRRREVLHDVSLRVGAGEIVGLIGETGAGKTTLARTILGLNHVDRGSISVAREDVTRFSPAQRKAFRRSGSVQFVFQDPLQSLDPDLTVKAAIGEGLAIRGTPRSEIERRVTTALELVGLSDKLAQRVPGELSGGQRQRVAIARAMAVEPALLLCDEPVSALDAASRIEILDLLRSLRERRRIGILFISHDLGSIAAITDRVAVLYRGEVVETGTTEQILLEPEHPYTRLLVGSAPSLVTGSIDRATRDSLRRRLDEIETRTL
jgi:ABC-type glutathione transport system ATPase component